MSNTIWIIILCLCVGANLYTISKGGKNVLIGGTALAFCAVALVLRVMKEIG